MKKYEKPKIELIVFSAADVIATSGDETGGWNGPEDPVDLPPVGF